MTAEAPGTAINAVAAANQRRTRAVNICPPRVWLNPCVNTVQSAVAVVNENRLAAWCQLAMARETFGSLGPSHATVLTIV